MMVIVTAVPMIMVFMFMMAVFMMFMIMMFMLTMFVMLMLTVSMFMVPVFMPMIMFVLMPVIVIVFVTGSVGVPVDGGVVMVGIDRGVFPFPDGDLDPINRFDVGAGIVPLRDHESNRPSFRGREGRAVAFVDQDAPIDHFLERDACCKFSVA